ncbi:MAG: hypothetical protein GX591_09130 [Planctomycetes bacterium]|nr:hypothetical protein [Planctomycetota bacterium]
MNRACIIAVAVVGLWAVAAPAGYYGVWAADDTGQIHLLDPEDATPLASFDPGLSHPIYAMTQVDEEVWVAGAPGGMVTVLDLDGNVVGERHIEHVSSRITAIAQAENELWVGADRTVTRHTMNGDYLGPQWQTAGDVAGLACTPGRTWIADSLSPCLVGLAPYPSTPGGQARYISEAPITGLTAMHRYVGNPADTDPPLPPILTYVGMWVAHGAGDISVLPEWDDPATTLPNGLGVEITALADVIAHRDPRCPYDVDLDDFALLKNNFGRTGVWGGWAEGDFNDDGAVDLDDFALLKRCFWDQCAVPEPATAALLALAAPILRRRRGGI